MTNRQYLRNAATEIQGYISNDAACYTAIGRLNDLAAQIRAQGEYDSLVHNETTYAVSRVIIQAHLDTMENEND